MPHFHILTVLIRVRKTEAVQYLASCLGYVWCHTLSPISMVVITFAFPREETCHSHPRGQVWRACEENARRQRQAD